VSTSTAAAPPAISGADGPEPVAVSEATGVLGVSGITVDNLPYTATVDSGGTLTVAPAGGSTIQTTVRLRTLLGSVTCVYRAAALTGKADNADSSIAFTNQQFTKVSGSSLCFSSGYFTAKYAPVTDAGAPVYVNGPAASRGSAPTQAQDQGGAPGEHQHRGGAARRQRRGRRGPLRRGGAPVCHLREHHVRARAADRQRAAVGARAVPGGANGRRGAVSYRVRE
jgi:hypothetical protein